MKYGLAQIILPQIENCLVVGKQEIVVNSNTFNKALYGSKSAQMVQPQWLKPHLEMAPLAIVKISRFVSLAYFSKLELS